jgi:cytoskeletal protein CcmA (bactofilin family)
MARDRNTDIVATPETVISIIGPGMRIVGDCETDGTVRVEGTVEGSIRAGKAVVVGKDGLIKGDVTTQDAVVSGRVVGTLTAESRLELQSSSHVEGEIFARRMQLEDGAMLNGTVHMGEMKRRTEPRDPLAGSGSTKRDPAVKSASPTSKP